MNLSLQDHWILNKIALFYHKHLSHNLLIAFIKYFKHNHRCA